VSSPPCCRSCIEFNRIIVRLGGIDSSKAAGQVDEGPGHGHFWKTTSVVRILLSTIHKSMLPFLAFFFSFLFACSDRAGDVHAWRMNWEVVVIPVSIHEVCIQRYYSKEFWLIRKSHNDLHKKENEIERINKLGWVWQCSSRHYSDRVQQLLEQIVLGATKCNFLRLVWKPYFFKSFSFSQGKLVHFSLGNWKSHKKIVLSN
jgi:hypothetical protein